MAPRSFDVFSPRFKADPFPVLAQMCAAGPVVRARIPIIGPLWLVTHYDAVAEFLRDQTHFVREGKNAGKCWLTDVEWWLAKLFRAPAANMLAKDEPDHRRLRALVDEAFQRRSVEQMRGRIETLADGLLDDLAAQAHSADDTVEFLDFAQQLPLVVIGELLGLPARDQVKFTRWAHGLTGVNSLGGLLMLLPNLFRISSYFRQAFRQSRRQPRAGLLALLVQANRAGDSLSDDELMSMAFLLLFAGHVTTVHLISTGLLSLFDHPEQKAALLADGTKLPGAIEEMLRFNSPVQFSKPRRASQDMVFHGQPLKRGDYLMAVLAAANSDPAVFPEPERFDIARQPNPHLAFGTGIHVCLGLKLARLEAEVAFQRLLARFPAIRLAVPRARLQWAGGGIRAPKSLPVKLR